MAEESSEKYLHPRSASTNEDGTVEATDQGVSINVPSTTPDARPPPIKHMSAPAYQSPIRHHRRAPSRSKGVKETLDARSHYGSGDEDGASVHRINQYIIKQEIGRGSFGAVHLAQDQYGQEYAVKEFSKSRLRKRAQSNLLRNPNQGRRPDHIAAGLGFNAPLHRIASDKNTPNEANNSLSLIKEEIAIMKKLDHNNLVSLIEVLDDPQDDSLYMVLEMCKKGVAMKVGLDERAIPYDDETCRCWFRDMILGIEYLHAQGIIHRDIKPDNCLITEDDVLKIVDFGVSEMFEKQSEMATAKSAGSPAFMPPELCVPKHGQVSGRAADIWSMGVTLYCLRYGHIPFEKGSMIELYDSIRGDELTLDDEQDQNFADLIRRILEKDPEKRITMEELRNHPWVTRNGTDPLLSAEENCADLIEPPTEAEMDHAITGNMAHLLAGLKAVKRFKKAVQDKRGHLMEGLFGRDSRLVTPPHSLRQQSRSQETHDRRPLDTILVTAGINRNVGDGDGLETLSPDQMEKLTLFQSPDIEIKSEQADNDFQRKAGETEAHYKQRMETRRHQPDVTSPSGHQGILPERRSRTFPVDGHLKGHAHDPLEDTLYLNIGHDPNIPQSYDENNFHMVSESPPAIDSNIYELAYQDEMEKILARRGREPSMYMTRRVEHRDDIRKRSMIKDAGKHAARTAAAKFGDLSSRAYAARQSDIEAGKSAARSTAGKLSERWQSGAVSAGGYLESGKQAAKSGTAYASEYLEPWKQAAKDYASTGFDSSRTMAKNASEKLSAFYNKSGGASEGFSGSLSGAQLQTQDGAPEPGTNTSDKAATDGEASQVQVVDGDEQIAESNSQPTVSVVPETPSVPGGFSAEGSVSKEHIT